MDWYVMALKKYAVFNGRARRKEYWYFVLFYFIFAYAFVITALAIGTVVSGAGEGVRILVGLYGLAMFVPSLAVSVRRLHDIDRSGWWLLLQLIPLVGSIVLLVWAAQDSSSGENRFGPNPKDTTV